MAIGGRDSSSVSSSAAVHLLTSCGFWERVRRDLPEPRYCPTAVCLPFGELMVVGAMMERDRLVLFSWLPLPTEDHRQFCAFDH